MKVKTARMIDETHIQHITQAILYLNEKLNDNKETHRMQFKATFDLGDCIIMFIVERGLTWQDLEVFNSSMHHVSNSFELSNMTCDSWIEFIQIRLLKLKKFLNYELSLIDY